MVSEFLANNIPDFFRGYRVLRIRPFLGKDLIYKRLTALPGPLRFRFETLQNLVVEVDGNTGPTSIGEERAARTTGKIIFLLHMRYL